MHKSKKIISGFYAVLTAVIVAVVFFLFCQFQPVNLEIDFFDVGQGDAIFIQTPGHFHILVDGGVDNTVVYKLGQYLPFYDRQIDLMVLTHPDSDHLTGLIEVLRRYRVKAVLLTGMIDNSAVYQEFLRTIEIKKPRLILAGQYQGIWIESDLDLEILYPVRSIAGQKFKESNDSSIVAKLSYRNFSVLLTGDATIRVEADLIKQGTDLKSDILKVAHHGSKSCSGQAFLEKVNPQLAVISVGVNKFNHPNPEIITRFSNLNIPVLTTLNYGDIQIQSNGSTFWLLNKSNGLKKN